MRDRERLLSRPPRKVSINLGLSTLTSLKDKLNREHAALVVVDMQNDFCSPSGAADRTGRDISMIPPMIPNLLNLIDETRRARVPILFVRCVYNTTDGRYLSQAWLEQAQRQKHGLYLEVPLCVEGSWGWNFVEGIEPKDGEAVITKHRYDAFLDTDFDLVLRSKRIRTLVMTGVTTNCCVESTARHGFMQDYHIVLVRDCTAAYSNKLYEASLENIDRLFGQVVSSEELLASWG